MGDSQGTGEQSTEEYCRMKRRQWYRIEAQADEPMADLYIFDEIGKSFWNDEAVSAKQVVDEISELSEEVGLRVHINSLGGDFFDGLAIANELRRQRANGRTVETISEGVAASAASLVMMAGSPIRMGDNAVLMIHDPWGFVIGTAKDMRKTADTFDAFRDQAVATYLWNATVSAEEIAEMMAEETWLSADDAIAKGFATEKVDGLKAAASIDPRALARLQIPPEYRARVEALVAVCEPPEGPVDPPVAAEAIEVLALCREADCLDIAEELIAAGASLKAVRVRVAAETESRKQADARATEIRGLCEKANLGELAENYISGQMPTESIRAHLTIMTAKMDGIEIDGGLDPDQGRPGTATSWKKAFARASNRFAARRRDTK